MPVTTDRTQACRTITLGGECTLASAAELKAALVEWMSSGQDLQLVLEPVGEIDVSLLQLLWAAAREAERAGAGFLCRTPESAVSAARDAGFPQFPGACDGVSDA